MLTFFEIFKVVVERKFEQCVVMPFEEGAFWHQICLHPSYLGLFHNRKIKKKVFY
jgi:hypothetical protein